LKKGGFSIALAPLVTRVDDTPARACATCPHGRRADDPALRGDAKQPRGWPGFLIHDSHIFDGVNGRHIALLFKLRAGA
jgi:hypothetical protein